MNFEVVVVGGGIGGLTTAALLAARGVNVCLLERQSRTGGCVANSEQQGYAFEPTAGLYSGWEPDGLYQSIFSQLPIEPPQVDPLTPAYVVRLPDGCEIPISDHRDQFEDSLRTAFPECSAAAVAFYQLLDQASAPGRDAVKLSEPVATHLLDCSMRFHRFVDVQLQLFTQSAIDRCSLDQAALALTTPLRGMWAIRGGAQTLADQLAESLKTSGGHLRLNSPVLRLAYGADGLPIGVDLLSGERVTATRAIVSNLTVWDTYGKLIGLSRTPASISTQLKHLRAWGAYLLFLGMDHSAATRLSSSRILTLTDWQEDQDYSPDQAQFFFAAAPPGDPRAPEGKLAVTVSTFTNTEDWFSFHQDETAHEEQEQTTLEAVWARIHASMPELGDSIEVIESATPRTFYEDTRRKLGMVGRPSGSVQVPGAKTESGRTVFPNLFLVGDTSSSGFGLTGISEAAIELANALTERR
jgi:phytoene dehydrogenase-like protein